MLVESPGGFPPGITLDNILDRQSPRNRRIAEILSRCGLVERSVQGMNLIYELCIREAKELPDFTGTDNSFVRINLSGIVISPRMLALINRMGNELANLVTDDFMVIHYLFKNEKVPDSLHARYKRLLDMGIIEKINRGKYILARKYYAVAGRAGVHTRLKGLDHEQNKTLVLNHLKNNRLKGIPISEFQQVLPMLPRNGIKLILNELRDEGKIY
ncbi:MAG: ATP-binding protein, partial [Planctomycetia bacterium]|nr:ATP-binding protein [Planctomycetia bacterium]